MFRLSPLQFALSDYYFFYIHKLVPYLFPLAVAFLVLLLGYLVYQLIRLVLILKQANGVFTLLELQPLKKTEQSAFTTEQLFAIIHGLSKQRPFFLRLFEVTKLYSLEIVSTKERGITYLVRVPKADAELLRKTLLSYLPGMSVKETADYLPPLGNYTYVTEYRLSHHFAYPLIHRDSLAEHDPIAYLTGSMTKLSADDLISFQIVLSPLRKASVASISRISKHIYLGKPLTGTINDYDTSPMGTLLFFFLRIILLPIGLMVFLFTNGHEGPWLTIGSNNKSSKNTSPFQRELERLIKLKLDQQLYRASVRLLTASNTQSELHQRQRSFGSALSSLHHADYQSITLSTKIRLPYSQEFKLWLFAKRIVLPFSSLILSTTEVSDLYHLPYTSTTKTEDLMKQQSKELPAPLSLKQTQSLDVIFAENLYGGNATPIGLNKNERRRHVYILGATGTGKSTMLLSMLKQDIEHNKGLCLVDPHGDLVDQVLSVIPKNRIQDVVYFNPDDISFPMGINLLELTSGLENDFALREKEFIAESIISVFNKIYSDKYSGPRMEYILRNTIHTAFTVEDATLFTVYKLLINPTFRKQVVRGLTDDNLKEFWKYEFAKAGDYQKVKMISPITNKIGRFLFSPTAKRILEQPTSTVSFDAIMNEGKILLCNLSKGKIGEDNSSVFGVLVMAKVQLAALKRARMKQTERKDFYLYVDEFQNFATPAFAQILSEARKYRLNAILAHQTTSQIETNGLVNVTLANTGTVICFRTANPEDERVILPQFRPYVDLGEIASLPSYHFYMRLGALNPQEPFSGVTTPTNIEYSQNRIHSVIESSRTLYTKEYSAPISASVKNTKIQPVKRKYSVLP